VPPVPAPKMPSAAPCRSGANQPLTYGTPTANEAPANPSRNPRTRIAPSESCQTASAARGSSVKAISAVNTRRRGQRGAPALEQAPAHVRVLQARRRVRVPRERGAPRTPARLVVGAVRVGAWVVDRLALPGDQPVLDVDVPRARAGAVDPVGGAHDLVVAPAVAIGGLPAAAPADQHAPPLGAGLPLAEELVGGDERRARARARSCGYRFVGIVGHVNDLSRPTSRTNVPPADGSPNSARPLAVCGLLRTPNPSRARMARIPRRSRLASSSEFAERKRER
jgi:hypothetical protein